MVECDIKPSGNPAPETRQIRTSLYPKTDLQHFSGGVVEGRVFLNHVYVRVVQLTRERLEPQRVKNTIVFTLEEECQDPDKLSDTKFYK